MLTKTVRVLQVTSAMNRGGAETMIMNIYRNIDRRKVQFDFVSHREEECHYDQEIRKLGGRIFYVKSLGQSGPIKYINDIKKIINKNGPYIAIHSHTDFQSGFVAFAGKLAGVKKRICHSHNTNWPRSKHWFNELALQFLKTLIRTNATDLVGCGKEAAKFLFDTEKATVLPNAIDLDVFKRAKDLEIDYYRSEFGINVDTKVIGHIGRFSEQKNHLFILKLAEFLRRKSLDFRILLIGDGPLRSAVETEINNKGLSNYIQCLGIRSDIPELMNLFNVFLLPSLYEGLPVVLVEAQAAGVNCVISSTITDEVDMGLGLIKKVSLDEDLEFWENALTNALEASKPDWTDIYTALTKKGYNIKQSVQDLMQLYGI